MKKLLIFVLSFCSFLPLQAQSAYQVMRQAQSAKIVRHLRAPVADLALANQVALIAKPTILSTYATEQLFHSKRGNVTVPQINVVVEYRLPKLKSPSMLWGSYQGLRAVTSLARDPKYVNDKYLHTWSRINITNGYNGVHHIVNKSTLKQIYSDMKAEAMAKGEPFTINLDMLQKEAPASLHPFHGKPEYSVIFHNLDRQMQLYNEGGVKAIIMDYFTETRNFHLNYPDDAPAIPLQVMTNTLQEAELWAKTFNLKWE